jgi:hypothetical protein
MLPTCATANQTNSGAPASSLSAQLFCPVGRGAASTPDAPWKRGGSRNGLCTSIRIEAVGGIGWGQAVSGLYARGHGSCDVEGEGKLEIVCLLVDQTPIFTTTPAGKALFGMMGVFAEFERSIIQERVRAGLERARREGKRLGRPPLNSKTRERIQEALKAPGRPGVRKIAEQFGVNASTVQQISRGI